MGKRQRIIYWIFTVWLCFGMFSSAYFQLTKLKAETDMISHLGYPYYFINIIATWKIAGVVAVLLPGLPVLKEWAYAGFFFVMSGAAVSHIVMGDPFKEIFPALLTLILIIISWATRPRDRRPATAQPINPVL